MNVYLWMYNFFLQKEKLQNNTYLQNKSANLYRQFFLCPPELWLFVSFFIVHIIMSSILRFPTSWAMTFWFTIILITAIFTALMRLIRIMSRLPSCWAMTFSFAFIVHAMLAIMSLVIITVFIPQARGRWGNSRKLWKIYRNGSRVIRVIPSRNHTCCIVRNVTLSLVEMSLVILWISRQLPRLMRIISAGSCWALPW